MSSYRPITNNRQATATDRVISIEKQPFESAPALSFLNSYEETITAVPVFYDPFKPGLTNAAPVSYNINRTINTLSDRTVALRHNGNTVDMEISVDSYTYIPQEPIVAPFSINPTLPKIREGDFYNRSTTTYVYKDVEVPKASNKIWDGRYSRCVDLQGYDVPNTNRLPEVIAEVQSKLDNPAELYTVLPISGMATTVAPPKKDPYAATYKVKVQQFIATNYNSLALTRHPKGRAETDLYQELPKEGGDKKFTLQEGFVAAVLDGPYFVRWANVYRYADNAPDPDDDCGHKIVEYDKDGDAVIVLGHLCGKEPPEPLEKTNEALNNAINKIKNTFASFLGSDIIIEFSDDQSITIPYIDSNEFFWCIPLSLSTTNAASLSVFISLSGIPDGVTVFINGQPYNVEGGGILYEFPLDTVTGQPIVPDCLPVTFNGNLTPSYITASLTYILVKVPAQQNNLFQYSVTLDVAFCEGRNIGIAATELSSCKNNTTVAGINDIIVFAASATDVSDDFLSNAVWGTDGQFFTIEWRGQSIRLKATSFTSGGGQIPLISINETIARGGVYYSTVCVNTPGWFNTGSTPSYAYAPLGTLVNGANGVNITITQL